MREDVGICSSGGSLGQGASTIETESKSSKTSFSSCGNPVQCETSRSQTEHVFESSTELPAAVGAPQIELSVESRRLIEGLVRVQSPVVEAMAPSTNPTQF